MSALGPITAEELAWGLECLAEGDVMGEIADWSGRSTQEWAAALAAASAALTPRQALQGRDASIAKAYEACLSWELIGRLHDVSSTRAQALVARLVAAGAVQPRPAGAGRLAQFAERRQAYLEQQGYAPEAASR